MEESNTNPDKEGYIPSEEEVLEQQKKQEELIEQQKKEEERKRREGNYSLDSLAFAPLAFASTIRSIFKKPQLLEEDSEFRDLKKQKEKAWLKERSLKKRDALYNTQEGIDFLFGTLDGSTESLRDKAEKEFRENAPEKRLKKINRYDEKKKEAKNPKKDSSLHFLNSNISEEIQLRYTLMQRVNPKMDKKTLNSEYDRLSQQVKEKAWEDYVKKYPEKAKEYAKDKFQKNEANIEIRAALQRIQEKNKIAEDLERDKQKTQLTPEETVSKLAEINTPVSEVPEKTVSVLEQLNQKRIEENKGQFGIVRSQEEPISSSRNEEAQNLKTQIPPSPRPTFPFYRRAYPGQVRIDAFPGLGRIPQRGGGIDRINNVASGAKRLKNKVLDQGKQMIKKTALKVGKKLLTNPYVLAAIAVILIILLIIFTIIFFSFGGSTSDNNQNKENNFAPVPGLSLTKTGPSWVDNGQEIKYQITISYSGDKEVVIKDPIPSGTSLIKSRTTGNYIIDSNTVIWALKDNSPSVDASGLKTYSFELTVLPGNDITVTNHAYAEAEETVLPPGGGGEPPSNNTCNNKYTFNNPMGKNYGDPVCSFNKDLLYLTLKEQDPKYADDWYFNIVRCESSYNPNAFFAGSPDAAGAWGLFQMGRGKNGKYDHGDVAWQDQITNAISYNKMINQSFRYWECARYMWR
ncbi:hypothetical protein M1307_03010 [Patescibacteria group bacterium]|nr:hypothetical protein [Patescibacteria group bacterium]